MEMPAIIPVSYGTNGKSVCPVPRPAVPGAANFAETNRIRAHVFHRETLKIPHNGCCRVSPIQGVEETPPEKRMPWRSLPARTTEATHPREVHFVHADEKRGRTPSHRYRPRSPSARRVMPNADGAATPAIAVAFRASAVPRTSGVRYPQVILPDTPRRNARKTDLTRVYPGNSCANRRYERNCGAKGRLTIFPNRHVSHPGQMHYRNA